MLVGLAIDRASRCTGIESIVVVRAGVHAVTKVHVWWQSA